MKKIVLLLANVVITWMMAHAQSGFYIDPASHELEFSADATAQQAVSQVYNNTSITRTFRWQLFIDQEPEGWIHQVCDKNLCYAPDVLTKDFFLNPDSNGLLRLDVTANNVSGEGDYRILVYDINDSMNYNATMTVHAMANPTGISLVPGESISIYPNPAKEVLNMNLNTSKHITSININNLVGQKIKTINVQKGVKSVAIPVNDLKKGIYFVRVFSDAMEVATKTFSKD